MMYLLTTTITALKCSKIYNQLENSSEKYLAKEYLHGVGQEIYPTTIPPSFKGMSFTKASALIFKHFGAAVFALGVPNGSFLQKRDEFKNNTFSKFYVDSADFDLILNPGDKYILRGGELCFFIAGSVDIALKIRNSRPDIDVQFEEAETRSSLETTKSWRPLTSFFNGGFSQLERRSTILQTGDAGGEKIKERLNLDGDRNRNHLSVTISDVSDKFQESWTPPNADAADSLNLSVKPIKNASAETNIISRVLAHAMGMVTTDKIFQPFNTVSSVTTARYPDSLPEAVSRHILLCDSSPDFPNSLEFFFAPLRSPHLKNSSKLSEKGWSPIVILSPATMDNHQRNIIEQFDDVYVIKGNPMQRDDLRRAGAERCRKAIVFSDRRYLDQHTSVDSPALLTVLNIEDMAKDSEIFVTTEFQNADNMRYVASEDVFHLSKMHVIMQPAFLSGHVYLQSILDRVICQNYYNPHLLNILRHMLFSGIFESDNVVTSDLHSHLWLLEIPRILAGLNYAELYAYLCIQHNAVALGLYRTNESSQQKFVLVNP